jgi:hypothetical protein
MRKLIPLMLVLFFSCKKTDSPLSGKMELSVKQKTSVTIKNGTNNSVNLSRWQLKEEIITIPTNIIHGYRLRDSVLLQKGNSITYSAATLNFNLTILSKISLYDSANALIATN